jgi:hypothetical protein
MASKGFPQLLNRDGFRRWMICLELPLTRHPHLPESPHLLPLSHR